MNGFERQRRKQNITQTALAKKISVSQAIISQWESGEALPRADKLPLLAEVLGCSIDELFDNDAA